MPRWIRLLALPLVLTLLAAACGDDDDEEETAPTTGADQGPFELDDPVEIVLLAEKKGESPAAIPNYFDGATLAIDHINEDGGVGGQDVELQQITTPLDPTRAETALLQAVDEDPTAIVGFPASTQVVPIGPKVDEVGIPMIYLSAPPQAFRGESAGSEWAFIVRPRNTGIASEVARYAVEELGAEKLGLICVNNPFGTTGCAEAKAVIEDLDAEVTAERTNEANATDLTEQVTAMRGTDAVIDFNFPNPLGVAANQLIDNGIEIPHLDGASAEIAVSSGAVKGPAAESLYGVVDCVPTEDERTDVQEWAERYEQRFGYAPNYASAEAYDAVRMVAAAVEEAESVEPEDVADALRELQHEGICDPEYAADDGQGLHHLSYIVTFTAEGAVQVEREFEVLAPEPDGESTSTSS